MKRRVKWILDVAITLLIIDDRAVFSSSLLYSLGIMLVKSGRVFFFF